MLYVLGSLVYGTYHTYRHWEKVQACAEAIVGFRATGKHAHCLFIGSSIGVGVLWPFLAMLVVRSHARQVWRWLKWMRAPRRLRRKAKLVCLAAYVRRIGEDMARISAAGEP